MNNLSDEARKLKNQYHSNWKKKNPDKVKQYDINHGNRKAASYAPEQLAKDLSASGVTQREIASRLNLSVGTVNTYLNA